MSALTGLDLLATRHWTWRLARNQARLGQIIIFRNMDDDGSLADLDVAEWTELAHHLRAFEQVMREAFVPDRFNYMQLGNVLHSVHVHAIPRYRTARTWGGVTFTDARWGGPPEPEPASPLDAAGTIALAGWLRRRIAEAQKTPAIEALRSAKPDHGGDRTGSVA